MKIKPAAAAAATALLFVGVGHAQYTGPSATKPAATTRYANVAEILKNPAEDVRVSLQGQLVRKIGKEKYLFSDGSGEIRVEIDNERFPAMQVDDKTRVTIEGEVEKDFLQSPEIDVKKLTVAS
jgi:uncharacterized protein (TIGR00156 family)